MSAQQNLTTVWLTKLNRSSVCSIEKALYSLTPRPTCVRISVGTRSITVSHPKSLQPQAIRARLANAGFDLVAERKRPPTGRPAPSIVTHSARQKTTKVSPVLASESDEEIFPAWKPKDPERDSPPADKPLRIVVLVNGMTCAACTSAVTDALCKIDGVSQVAVDLVERSAKMVVEREELVDTAVETVNDCGFEAQLFSKSVESSNDIAKGPASNRSVTLRISGMVVPECSRRVMKSLDDFGSQITILKALTSPVDPTLKLSYQPAPPDFTIRDIISKISNAKSPPYSVSVVHPPTIEEVGRAMQRREQWDLLQRLIITAIIAIPTFVIGIVYMTLVSKTNPGKVLLMQPMWIGDVSRFEWSLLILATPVMFHTSSVYHLRALKEIRAMWKKGSTTPLIHRFTRFGSMNLLVSSGVSVAYFASIALLVMSALRPAQMDAHQDKSTYFDTVVFLTMFLLAGKWLEAYSKSHAAAAITALNTLRPTEAFLLVPGQLRYSDSMSVYSEQADVERGRPEMDNGFLAAPNGYRIEKVDVNLLEVGDIVRVHKGSTPPADGALIRGQDSAFDESSLTGESRPVMKQIGDRVFVGSIPKANAVDIQVTAIEGGTMLGHIIQVVRDGLSRKAPIERLATYLVGYFVPTATLLAIVTWLVWLILGLSGALPESYMDIDMGGWPIWSLQFSIAVFVVACPCGIGLAAPTALLVGSGLAAKFGIMARGGGEAFQEMAQVDIVVFDKTGTITLGESVVSEAEILPTSDDSVGLKPQLILGIAAELGTASSHPVGQAIMAHCQNHAGESVTGSTFEEKAGFGLKAHFPAHRCTAILGNEAWMRAHEVAIAGEHAQRLSAWKREAKSICLLAIRQETADAAFRLAAMFAIADPIRPETQTVIDTLGRWGISVWMISGDNEQTAMAVARVAGIPPSNVFAGVLPHEKAEKIEWLKGHGSPRQPSQRRRWLDFRRRNKRCVVAMVGDGINDAPALSMSDVGIAVGSGSDIAKSSASFVLVTSNLCTLLTLRDLSCKILARIKFNFGWAICYNAIAVPVAAGILFPLKHTRLSPVWASLAMALSSISVICSSLLLRLYKEPSER